MLEPPPADEPDSGTRAAPSPGPAPDGWAMIDRGLVSMREGTFATLLIVAVWATLLVRDCLQPANPPPAFADETALGVPWRTLASMAATLACVAFVGFTQLAGRIRLARAVGLPIRRPEAPTAAFALVLLVALACVSLAAAGLAGVAASNFRCCWPSAPSAASAAIRSRCGRRTRPSGSTWGLPARLGGDHRRRVSALPFRAWGIDGRTEEPICYGYGAFLAAADQVAHLVAVALTLAAVRRHRAGDIITARRPPRSSP